ncbi:MAG: hypothetical protein ACYTF9_09445, partial [Planctomycetota bacterium]
IDSELVGEVDDLLGNMESADDILDQVLEERAELIQEGAIAPEILGTATQSDPAVAPDAAAVARPEREALDAVTAEPIDVDPIEDGFDDHRGDDADDATSDEPMEAAGVLEESLVEEADPRPANPHEARPPVSRRTPWQVIGPHLVKLLVLANYPVRFLPGWAHPMVDWLALSLVFWVPVIWVLVLFVLR